MILVKRESTKIFALNTSGSATDVRVSIVHEWGDVVKEEVQIATGPGTEFTYTATSTDLASAGAHKLIWKYLILGVEFVTTVWFQVYTPYQTASVFFDEYSYLDKEKYTSRFDSVERVVRETINDFCGQDFQYINNKTLTIDGSGRSTLGTIYRLDELHGVTRNGSDDVTQEVEIHPQSDFYIRKLTSENAIDGIMEGGRYPYSRYFNARSRYAIRGSFGWPYVPQNVVDAASILIADEFNQDSAYRKHGITFTGVGPVQTRYHPDLQGTTGNIDADILLMDYSRWTLEQI